MTDKDKLATKEKIVAEASKLFARFGFSGTSVREIASASGVNIAAVNYHFGSKHNLYWAVVDGVYTWCDSGITEIAKSSANMEEMAVNVLNFITEDKDMVRTIFKIMLTDGVPEPDVETASGACAQEGPPGLEAFLGALSKDVGNEVKESSMVFAVKTITSVIFHFAMICSSSRGEMVEDDPFLSPEEIEKTIRHQVRAVCAYIKANPEI